MTLISLDEGSVFAERYRIVRCIAQEGMGAVYEVVHTTTQQRRALKVMHANLLQGEELHDRFRQAACVTARIQSDYIVDVLDAGLDEHTQMLFLVMELLQGVELDKRLKRQGKLDPKEAVTYLHHVALALDRAHRAAIVHRDIKPGNVFLTEQEDGSFRAKILDFGIARLVLEGATSAEAAQSLGTPLYMAPEQFNIGQKVSPAADVFSLGMMAYTLLVGAPYWQEEVAAGANIFAFAAKAMHGPPEPATVRAKRQGARLPSSFDEWFARATDVAPQARFPKASAASAALAKVFGVTLSPEQERTSLSSLNPEPPGDLEDGGGTGKGSSQKRYAVIIAAVALGLALAGGGVLLLRREAELSPGPGVDETKHAADTPAPGTARSLTPLDRPGSGAHKTEPTSQPMPGVLPAAAQPTAAPTPGSQPDVGDSTAAKAASPASSLDPKPPLLGTATSPVKKRPPIERD